MRETPGAPVQHLRLVRPEVLPIAGQFRQAGHAVVGQLLLTGACNTESVEHVKRQEVTEMHTNRRGAVGWVVVGGVIAAVGAGLLAASGNADQHVTCGEQRAGDRCYSEASAMEELGLTTLLAGLTAGVTGGVFLARKPQLETKELPEREASHVISVGVACAPTGSLNGVVVGFEIPGQGTWSARAAADGAVRIEVPRAIPLPEGTTVQVVVESTPATFGNSVTPGATLGEVRFERQRAAQLSSPRLASKR